METRYTYEITGDFLSFVEALEAVLRAEDKIEKAYILSYGEGGEVGEGEYMFKQTGTEGRLSEMKKREKRDKSKEPKENWIKINQRINSFYQVV